MTWKQMKKVAKPLRFKWKTKTGRQGGLPPPAWKEKGLVMGTRKEALGKVSSALKELTVACIGWPWIKKRPMQLNVGRVQDDVEAFKGEFGEFAEKVEFDIKIISAAVNDAQDEVTEVRQLLKELASDADKRITALEKAVAEYVAADISSPEKTKSHEEYVSTPIGEQPTRAFLHGVQNKTKEEMAEYANWARNAGVFAPISYKGSDGPLTDWADNKRSRMLRLMLDLRLLKIVTEGGYGGPKTVVFTGSLKTWKYTRSRLDKISLDLFKEGKGKWLGTKALAQLDNLEEPPEELEQQDPEPETVEGLMEAAQIAEDAGLMNEYIELYARAEILQNKLDNKALSNGDITYLPEHKDEGAEQKNYHVGATKTDLGSDWAEKYRDKRGNREY